MTVPANEAKTGHLGDQPLAGMLPFSSVPAVFTKSEPEPK